MKKVCIVTAARSEYGLLRWTIDGVYRAPNLELLLVVTGAHLSKEHGDTWRNIEEDGYLITAKVDMALNSDTKEAIVESMGRCCMGFAKVFAELQPDIVMVLGDRYELLSVWTVGEPGLDNFRRSTLMTRQELAEDIGIPIENKWILVTLHPETNESLEYNLQMAKNIITLTDSKEGVSVIISKANADFGSNQINEYWTEVEKQNPWKYQILQVALWRLPALELRLLISVAVRQVAIFVKMCIK